MLAADDDLQSALRHEGALRRLAAMLGSSPHDADDAVQHTLVQAAAARRPAGAPLLPFLRAVLRRFVLNERKLAARRRRREAACATNGVALPVDDLIAREQLRRRVAEAVLALPEPFRTTVWLRWFEGLGIGDVARRTDVPAATVRTRLLRAHERLRARLDRDYGDRRWCTFAAPLGAAAPSAAAAAILAGALVKKLVAGAAGAALVAIAAWSLLQPPQPVQAPVAQSRSAAAAASAPAAEPVREREDAAVAVAPPAKAAAAPIGDPTEAQVQSVAGIAAPGCIEGVVLDGTGPLGGRAWLLASRDSDPPWGPPSDWDTSRGVQRCMIGDDGRFSFANLQADTYAVGVTTSAGISRHVHVELHDDAATARIVFALGSARIEGRVFTPDGAPGADWYVALWNVGRMLGGTQGVLATRANGAGAFVIGGLCGGDYRIEATPRADLRDASKQGAFVALATGEVTAVDIGEPATACDWTGRVLLPSGSVLATPFVVDLELANGNRRTACRLAGDGSFRCRAATGDYTAALYFAIGVSVTLGTVNVAGRAWSHDLVLPGGVLRVRPTWIAAASPQWPRTALRARLSLPDGRTVESVRGNDGNEYFFAVPPGTHRLQVWPHAIAGAPRGGTTVIMTALSEVDVDVTLNER